MCQVLRFGYYKITTYESAVDPVHMPFTVHPWLSEHVQISETPSCKVSNTIVCHDYISI